MVASYLANPVSLPVDSPLQLHRMVANCRYQRLTQVVLVFAMTSYKRRHIPKIVLGGAQLAKETAVTDKRKPRDGVNPVDSHVGKQLRAIRTKLGVSQEKLAAELGVSFQQIQKYENGANRVSASRLQMASTYLEVPVSYFFDGAPAPEKRQIERAVPAPETKKREGAEMRRLFEQIEDQEFRAHLLGLARAIVEKERLLAEAGTEAEN